MRHTGGLAWGDTSTKSRPFSAAAASASSMGITPNCSPSGSTTRTSLARISRLMFVSCLAMGHLLVVFAAFLHYICTEFIHAHRLKVLTVSKSRCNRSIFHLLVANDKHVRYFLQLRFA